MTAFDRTPKPPKCQHPFHLLNVPEPDEGRATIPRVRVICTECKQSWRDGEAFKVHHDALKAKLLELENLARRAVAGAASAKR